jgi:hypothetical protein
MKLTIKQSPFAVYQISTRFEAANDRIKQVLLNASNVANHFAKSKAIDFLTAELNCPVGQIQSRVEVTPATASNPYGELAIMDKPLIKTRHFSPVQTRRGVYYRPYRKGSGEYVRHGFGPNIRRLGRNVFVREGKKRMPIRMVPGVSLADAARRIRLEERIRPFIEVVFVDEYNKGKIGLVFGRKRRVFT